MTTNDVDSAEEPILLDSSNVVPIPTDPRAEFESSVKAELKNLLTMLNRIDNNVKTLPSDILTKFPDFFECNMTIGECDCGHDLSEEILAAVPVEDTKRNIEQVPEPTGYIAFLDVVSNKLHVIATNGNTFSPEIAFTFTVWNMIRDGGIAASLADDLCRFLSDIPSIPMQFPNVTGLYEDGDNIHSEFGYQITKGAPVWVKALDPKNNVTITDWITRLKG